MDKNNTPTPQEHTTQEQLKNSFIVELQYLAKQYNISRFQVTTLNFKWDFTYDPQTSLLKLTNEKAIVRALGRTASVSIGEGTPYPTYEDAEQAMKEKWRAYFRERRRNMTDKQRQNHNAQQKRYRQRMRDRKEEFLQHG